jgi:hypothetical protein
MNDQELEVSIPVEPYAESYADDGKPFTPPAHREWEKQLHAQGLKPGDVDPWYGVFRDVRRGEIAGPFQAVFRSTDRSLPDVRAHVLEPSDGDLYVCTVPTLRKCWSNALQVEDHSLVESFRMPKMVLRRDGEDLKSRFVVLWEPHRGTEWVGEVRDLAPESEGLVGIEVRMSDGGTVQMYYASDLSTACSTGDGVEFQGRYATVIRQADGVGQLYLYDSVRFKGHGFDVEVVPRPPLAAVEVIEDERKSAEISLEGTWPDLRDGQSWDLGETGTVILSQGEAHRRVLRVREIYARDGRTFLRCDGHPGFRYDRESQVLTEILTPYNEIHGRAEVSLASRVRVESDPSGTVATDTVSVNGVRVERNTVA